MNLETSHFRIGEAERLLKAMASRARLMILCEVSKGERTVTELHQALGASMSSISQHLAVLRDERIVSTRRKSQHVYYSLANEAAETLLGALHEIYCAPRSAPTRVNPKRRSK
jgi:DNA-binding transcriptional ArsR family regulator